MIRLARVRLSFLLLTLILTLALFNGAFGQEEPVSHFVHLPIVNRPLPSVENIAELEFVGNYTIFVQHWGMMVGLFGVMMAAGSLPGIVANADLALWADRESIYGVPGCCQPGAAFCQWFLRAGDDGHAHHRMVDFVFCVFAPKDLISSHIEISFRRTARERKSHAHNYRQSFGRAVGRRLRGQRICCDRGTF